MSDVEEFFGCRRPAHADYPRRVLRTDTWNKDDSVWGETLFRHYQDRTRSLIEAVDVDAVDNDGSTLRIPKLIHFIWLGKDPIPPHPHLRTATTEVENEPDPAVGRILWNGAMRSFAEHHFESSGWRFRVWTDESVAELQKSHPPLVNDSALTYALSIENYGLASDILRLELLHKFGGLYIDIDYYALGSLEELHRRFDFYCGCSNTGCVELNNGLVGSKRGHPLLMRMMKEIITWFDKGNFQSEAEQRETASFLASFLDDASTSALKTARELQHRPTDSDVINHTGPGLLTRTICKTLLRRESGSRTDKEDSNLSFDHDLVAVLPSSEFHPFPNHLRGTFAKGADFSNQLMSFVVPTKTKAVHLWGCSWQK